MAIESGKSASARPRAKTTRQASATRVASELVTKQPFGKPWTYTRRGYAIAQCLKQLARHKVASLVTLMVFGITLALPVLIWFSSNSLAALAKRSVGEESITAYLSSDISDIDGAKLSEQLQQQPGIKRTYYVSRDEALALFNSQSNIDDAVAVLGENPLPGAVIIYPDDATMSESAMRQLAQRLAAVDSVDRVQVDLQWVKRLKAVLNLVRTIGWVLAGFLTLTALLVIGNTIRLELLRRRNEIDVAKLLGASQSFLQRPMLYAGALYGLLGGIAACVIALIAMNLIQGPADELSQLYNSGFDLKMPTVSHLLLVLASATLLGVLGAILTLYQGSRQLLPIRRTGI